MATAYPFDPTGTNPSNRVTGEQHVITSASGRNYHFIVPTYAPFFSEGCTVSYKAVDNTIRYLVEGIDFYFCFQFIAASRSCAKPIYGGISFLNLELAGLVTIVYQTVGGEWTLDPVKINEILSDTVRNPRVTSWEHVASVPTLFPAVDHEWNLVDLVGMSDVANMVDEVAQAIANRVPAAGIGDYVLPLNKSVVGLGKVQNFGVATDTEAVEGTSITKYMTPRAVRKAIQFVTGSGSVSGVVAIANGGTGSTTASDALAALGAASSSHSHATATTSAAGFMSAQDKTKLDGLTSGGGGGGLQYMTEIRNVTAPNVTTPVHGIATYGAEADIDLSLSPKGTGAIVAHVPDNTSTGGNKRGPRAVDLQTYRTDATQVASGDRSVVSGGVGNTASGYVSAVSGGEGNIASQDYSVVSGGYNNSSTAYSSAVSGGYNNSSTNYYATVSGGTNNTSSGYSSTISGGGSNYATGLYSTVSGGQANSSAGQSSTISGGRSNVTNSDYAAIGGGIGNIASAKYSTVSGGRNGTASGLHATVSGGDANVASGLYSTVSGGELNAAGSYYATVSGGYYNVASGPASTVSGGYNNTATGECSTIPGGYGATTNAMIGVLAYGFDPLIPTQRQMTFWGGRLDTTTATPTRITADGGTASVTNQLTLRDKSAYRVRGIVVANSPGLIATKEWVFDLLIRRATGAASTIIVGAPIITSNFSDASTGTWAVTLSADTDNGALGIYVKGTASASKIHWAVVTHSIEMNHSGY